MAQVREPLVGTWKLVAASSRTRSGERIESPYGAEPVGVLTYTPEGRVTSLISYGGRQPLSMNAGAQEQAQAFNSFLGYTGRYSLTGDKVTHHIEISSIQNYVGKDLVRGIRFEGNRISLVTPPTMVNGKFQSIELTWERIVDDAAAGPLT
jgi:hypothetical protein